MSYKYSDHRRFVLSNDGVENIMKMYIEARKMTEQSGCFTAGRLIGKYHGDSWQQMACVEHLLGDGFLVEIHTKNKCAWQDRVLAGVW